MATRSKPKGKGKGKSKVKVVVRLRPLLDHESAEEQCISDVSEDSLQLWNYRTQNDTLKYTFDACYRCGVEQEAIFSREVQPLLPLILKGQNATCFAFGPTGAGKTFTMQGSPRCPGMIPRSIDHLFAAIDADEPKVNRSVTLSFLQIHQEKVYDLLEVSDKDLPVREDYDGRIVVPGLAEVSVRSSEEFHQVYERGLANRATSATALNSHSSRSHAVLTVKVHIFCHTPSTNPQIKLCLRMNHSSMVRCLFAIFFPDHKPTDCTRPLMPPSLFSFPLSPLR
eukprot:m.328296 g.328296  ORF g.328296 m.328296 type:complete len:282 (-) comp16032_c0_seq7:2198-3043(-)